GADPISGWRRRRHHALQLPEHGADVDDPGGDRHRQHLRAEAIAADTALGDADRRVAARGRAPRGRLQRRARRQRRRQPLVDPSGCGRGLVCRVGHGRGLHLRRGRGERKAKLIEYIDGAQTEGAQLVSDGRSVELKDGFFLGPTIFDRVTPNMKIWKEELFGPVLSVMRASDIDEALNLLNASTYGN